MEAHGRGHFDEAALSEFLAYGFRGVLPKPFTGSELAEALQKLSRPGK
jgi:DNA-binding NarL/FixJ family response regulator